jgi:hypothetical protein
MKDDDVYDHDSYDDHFSYSGSYDPWTCVLDCPGSDVMFMDDPSGADICGLIGEITTSDCSSDCSQVVFDDAEMIGQVYACGADGCTDMDDSLSAMSGGTIASCAVAVQFGLCDDAVAEANGAPPGVIPDYCPVSCGLCAEEGTEEAVVEASDGCVDTPDFQDENGYPCGAWSGYDCMTAEGEFDYPAGSNAAITENCPETCGTCDELDEADASDEAAAADLDSSEWPADWGILIGMGAADCPTVVAQLGGFGQTCADDLAVLGLGPTGTTCAVCPASCAAAGQEC